MSLFRLTRLPPNVAGRQRIVDSDICWIFGVFLSYWKKIKQNNFVLVTRPGVKCWKADLCKRRADGRGGDMDMVVVGWGVVEAWDPAQVG